MPVVSKEEIANAREMDLLSYLRAYEPDELVRFSGETYCTRTHDSLKSVTESGIGFRRISVVGRRWIIWLR